MANFKTTGIPKSDHRKSFRKKKRSHGKLTKGESKGTKNWANQSVWTMTCAQELGLLRQNWDSDAKDSQMTHKLNDKMNEDEIFTNYDTIVVIDPYGVQSPYEVNCPNTEFISNAKADNCDKSSGYAEEGNPVVNEEPTISVIEKIELMEVEETASSSGREEILAELTIDSSAADIEIPLINTDCMELKVADKSKETCETSEKTKRRRRNRNPLDYVNKTYRGINKIELDQKLYEDSLKQCKLHEGVSTRRIIKKAIEKREIKESKAWQGRRGRQKNQTPSAGGLPKFDKGQMVWGFCKGFWPALIIDADDAGMITINENSQYVLWLGENQISELAVKNISPISVHLNKLVHFLDNFKLFPKKYKACEALVELLYQKFSFTRTKPYGKWVEKHFFKIKEKLDSIRYYPYPDKIQARLNQLKEINGPQVAKYLLKESKKRSNQNENKPSIESTNNNCSNMANSTSSSLDDSLDLKDQKVGTIVWSKIMGHKWWPAMIVDFQDGGMNEPKFKHHWVMWYGDYTVSEVSMTSIKSFRSKFQYAINFIKDYLENANKEAIKSEKKNTDKELYFNSILQAAKDYCARLGLEIKDWTVKDVLSWMKSNESIEEISNPLHRYEYSDVINEMLCTRKINFEESSRKDDIENSDALQNVQNGKLCLESVCLVCLKCIDDSLEEHPLFTGNMCMKCYDYYLPTLFTYGIDGKQYFCCLCSGSGLVVMCSELSCPLVYCVSCVKHLICPNDYKQLMIKDPWKCFFCEKQSFEGLVKPRDDWKTRSSVLLKASPRENIVQLTLNSDRSKGKIRVLSLFDGISTGLLALKKLNIEVEIYYASEIDPDAIAVSHKNFPTEIKRLGDVRLIDDETIAKIAPIDLLIGGSPCNDLSIANPKRKGLNDPLGTGVLFYEYLRIKKLVEKANQGRHLFWLYENVASMPKEYRNKISKCFGCEPDVIDSAQFSAQHRVRLYWSNLQIYLGFYKSPDLQEMLDPHCGRLALVKKIRTITTCRNSLRAGRRHSLKPIKMNGEDHVLRISELERIFGLPDHYTDGPNVNLATRHKLIGKSWSVPTILAILHSLRNYFKTS